MRFKLFSISPLNLLALKQIILSLIGEKKISLTNPRVLWLQGIDQTSSKLLVFNIEMRSLSANAILDLSGLKALAYIGVEVLNWAHTESGKKLKTSPSKKAALFNNFIHKIINSDFL